MREIGEGGQLKAVFIDCATGRLIMQRAQIGCRDKLNALRDDASLAFFPFLFFERTIARSRYVSKRTLYLFHMAYVSV